LADIDNAFVRRLCQPIVDYFSAKGGELQYNARLQNILLGDDGSVTGFQLSDGRTITGDLYVSAMPGVPPRPPLPADRSLYLPKWLCLHPTRIFFQ
jgi:15-cis-phytoene desaturase